MLMKMGSMAMALIAEYGEWPPGAISFTGSNCRMSLPVSRSHVHNGTRSAISPMPQLREDGAEKSGSRTPA
jgi:hypothetical protein